MVLGQSIGAALAAYSVPKLKDEFAIFGLLVDVGFTGYRDAAQNMTSKGILSAILLWPWTWLITTCWDSEGSIADLSLMPLMMFHSPKDSVIDHALGEALYLTAREPKHWVESQGGHIQSFMFPRFRQ